MAELSVTGADLNVPIANDNVFVDEVVMRKPIKKRRSSQRMSVINGHLYDAEVSCYRVFASGSFPLLIVMVLAPSWNSRLPVCDFRTVRNCSS